jgi:NAD(P)-dependent dehydrogenase (short-subunit alcohol dehydrogenase family)
MLLKDKTAVVYGGSGAIGGAVARTFAREGAKVFIAGRTHSKLEAVAADIKRVGGFVDIAQVEALDPASVSRHADHVIATTGRIDVALNAIGIVHVQGPPLADLSLEDFLFPVTTLRESQLHHGQGGRAADDATGESGSSVFAPTQFQKHCRRRMRGRFLRASPAAQARQSRRCSPIAPVRAPCFGVRRNWQRWRNSQPLSHQTAPGQ